jgi:hypothetical protein
MSKLMPRLSHALRVTNGAQLCRSSGGCAPRCRGAPCVGDGIWRLFSDHIIRLDRYTEYNQSGYTNSETSPSTPRPETSCNPPLSHTVPAPRSGLAKRNGNTHKRLQITRRAPLNFRKAQANGEGSSDDLFVGQILQIRHTRLTVDLATPISLQSPKASPHETTSAALP